MLFLQLTNADPSAVQWGADALKRCIFLHRAGSLHYQSHLTKQIIEVFIEVFGTKVIIEVQYPTSQAGKQLLATESKHDTHKLKMISMPTCTLRKYKHIGATFQFPNPLFL